MEGVMHNPLSKDMARIKRPMARRMRDDRTRKWRSWMTDAEYTRTGVELASTDDDEYNITEFDIVSVKDVPEFTGNPMDGLSVSILWKSRLWAYDTDEDEDEETDAFRKLTKWDEGWEGDWFLMVNGKIGKYRYCLNHAMSQGKAIIKRYFKEKAKLEKEIADAG
jgi:hypothetical protein